MSLGNIPPQAGIVHTYGFNLTAFEFTTPSQTRLSPNIILFVGGLGNGLLNIPYLPQLAKAAQYINFFDYNDESWSVVQLLLSSSYSGWGTSSLDRDVRQIQRAVEYFRSERNGTPRKKIVLMGHSTGCQDAMHYITKARYQSNFPLVAEVDGVILQAPVSDQENFRKDDAEFDELVKGVYEEYILQGRENEILPNKYRKMLFNTPVTAYRFYSLTSKRGDDDYFSSYLTDEDYKNTFGKVTTPLLVLYSGSDKFVPEFVNKEELMEKWKQATDPQYWSVHSKIIKGADHDLGEGSDKDVDVIEDLLITVADFVGSLLKSNHSKTSL